MLDVVTKMHETALEFVALAQATDPAEHGQAEIILDTNVACELYSVRDILAELPQGPTAEALARRRFRHRAHRMKHTLILAWWLSRQNIAATFLGAEQINIVIGKLAPEPGAPHFDPLSFLMTTSFVHIIRDLVLGPWHLGTLAHVDHHKLNDDADDEILRIASADGTTVITWEGYQEDGTFSSDTHKLRNRCIAAGVPTFTPQEYLEHHGVDVDAEALEFIRACENASWTSQWENVLDGRKHVDLLIGFYRLVLLGVVDAELGRYYSSASG